MSNFLRWVTLTHTQRYNAHNGTSDEGHGYQGRFKRFPIQDDDHFWFVVRYVERNALRANFVGRAEDWKWGSLHPWLQLPEADPKFLSQCPLSRLGNWISRVNEPLTGSEIKAVR